MSPHHSQSRFSRSRYRKEKIARMDRNMHIHLRWEEAEQSPWIGMIANARDEEQRRIKQEAADRRRMETIRQMRMNMIKASPRQTNLVSRYDVNYSGLTWVEDIPPMTPFVIGEASWFEEKSRFPIKLPWAACPVRDCVLPSGHGASHEIWRPCGVKGCLRHQDHDGGHRMRSEELRDANIRLEREAQAAKGFWKTLSDLVLEAMRCRQIENEWGPEIAKIGARAVKTSRKKSLIPPPSLPRGQPSSPYRGFVLDSQQIRLFRLDPRTTASRITGSFTCAELSSCPAYTALSYTWGDGAINRKIAISNHVQLAIRENLWSFLSLQSSVITEPTLFWIDAICIDQSNTHERNHQVGLMKQIYANAAKVYVWLGQEAENSDIAMRFVTAQASRLLRRRGLGYYPLWTRQQGEALHSLCERPYWRRMWIIQELLHANNISVWCGSLYFSWVDLEKLYLKLKTVEEANWFAHHKFHMTVLHSSAAVMIWQRAHWRHPDTPVPHLQTLIGIFRDWHCSDLRDKVFALSGMATEESVVVPDYALTIRHVYFAVMRKFQGEEEHFGTMLLQILGIAGRDV
ncbi:heterokaryon incompatibility protein-domain-containing protein [Xylaria sp. FL1777]|nr:heterokaryon incompatibility protein-domain-containing protein [Xylaria sp. FL1777]